MSANTTRERDISGRGAQTPAGLLVLRPSLALLFAAVSIGVLVVLRGREPFVPPAGCYATLAAGSTSICHDLLRTLEWFLWPAVVVQAVATLVLTGQSVRLYFLNPRKTLS